MWEDQQTLARFVDEERRDGKEWRSDVRTDRRPGRRSEHPEPWETGPPRSEAGSFENGWRPAWEDAAFPGQTSQFPPNRPRMSEDALIRRGPEAFQRPLFETMADRWLARSRGGSRLGEY